MKHSKASGIIIIILTILYILFITKLADVLTNNSVMQDGPVGASTHVDESYATVIYILSIMGLVIGYFFIQSNSIGNYVIKISLLSGSVLVLMHTMIYYWEFLDEYTKLSLIAGCIVAILYYIQYL